MQAFDLNLASRPFKNNALLWGAHVASIVLLSLFSAWSVHTYQDRTRYLGDMAELHQTTKGEFDRLDQRDRLALQAIEKFDLEGLEVQAGRANQAIEWQAFSWTRLFNRMAEAQPHGFKMLSIRPIFRGGRAAAEGDETAGRQPGVPVMIEGVAKSFEAVTEIQNSLLAHPNFDGVEPERLDRTDRSEFLFKLRFHYLPDIEVDPEVKAADATAVAAVEAETDDARAQADGQPASDGNEPTEEDAEASDPALDLTQVDDAWNGGDEPSDETGAEPAVEPSAPDAAPAAGRQPGPPRSKAKGKRGQP